MAIKFPNQNRVQSSKKFNIVDTFVNDIKQAGSTLTKKLQYFNPESNGGQNFWSTPVAQKMGNIQKVTQPIYTPVKNTISQGAQSYARMVSDPKTNIMGLATSKLGTNTSKSRATLPGMTSKYNPLSDILPTVKGGLAAYGSLKTPLATASFGLLNPVFEGAQQLGSQILHKQPLKLNVDVPKSIGEGVNFGAVFGPINEATNYVLKPLLKTIRPVELNNIDKYLQMALDKTKLEGARGIDAVSMFAKSPYVKLATKRILQNLSTEAITGFVGGSAMGGLEPAQNAEERINNILAQGLQFAVMNPILGSLKYTGQGVGFAGKQILKNSPKIENIPLGLSTKAISKEEHYQNLTTQQKGEADLGGGKVIPTVKVGKLNIEEPVARAVSVTAGENSGSSGFHRSFSKDFNGLTPSWAIVYKTKPSAELISAAEGAGLKVNIRKNGITDVYLPDTLRGEPKKAQAVFDKFAETYQSTKVDQTLSEAGLINKNKPVVDTAYKSIVDNGGVTINTEGVQPGEGFAFSPYKGAELIIDKKNFSPESVASYLKKHQAELSQPGNHLGAWESEGKIYLDISRVGPPNAESLQNAINNKQLAAFDLKTFEEIPLGKIDKGVYNKLYEASNHPYLNQKQNATTGVPGVVPEPQKIPPGQEIIQPEGVPTPGVIQTPEIPQVDINLLRQENFRLLNKKSPGESVETFLKRNPKIADQFNQNKAMMAEDKYRQRSFLKQVQTSANSPDFVKEAVATLPQEYRQVANDPTWEEAIRMVYDNPDKIKDRLLNSNDWVKDPGKRPALYISLAQKYFKEGNQDMGLQMIDEGAKEATLNGQNTQAWVMWSNMTPVGMVRMVQQKLENFGEKETQIGKLGEKVGQSILHKVGIKTKATGDVVKQLSSTVSTGFNDVNKQAAEKIRKELEQLDLGFLDKTINPDVAKNARVVTGSTSLANRVKKSIQSTNPVDNPVRDMVNTLFGIAKEVLPDQKKVPTDPITFITKALANKAEYKEVWLKATDIVKQKYANNPEALQTLEPYFAKALGERVFSKSQANKVVSQEMKRIGADISQIVKEHYTKAESVKIELSQKIAEKTGLTEEQAKPLTDYIAQRFDELTSAKKSQLLEKALAEKKVKLPKDTPEERDSYLKEIIKLSNLGAFSEDKYLEPLAKKLGLPTMTPEMAKDIYTKMEDIQTEKNPAKKLEKITAVFDSINEITPPGFWETIDVMRYNGMLSGFKPQLRNFFGNAFALFPLRTALLTQEVVNDWVKATLHGTERQRYFKEVPAYVKGFINAIPDGTMAWVNGWKGIARNENPDLRSLRLRQFPKKVTFASNMLEAFDRAFTTLGMGGEISALKVRGIKGEEASALAKNTTEQMIYRNKLDPKNKTGQGHLLAGWDKTIEAVQKLAKDIPVIKWVVPFIRISGMTSKEAMQYTPVLSSIATVGAEGIKRDQMQAKKIIGLGAMSLGFMLALQGRTTWDAPTDEKKRKAFYDSGRIPFAIEIGKTWVPMQFFGPLIFCLGIPAAMRYYSTEDPKVAAKVGTDKWTSILLKTVGGQVQLFSAQTFLQSFNTLVKLVNQDPDVNVASFFAQTAATVNPWNGALRSLSQVIDPTYRKAEGALDTIFKDLPGLSQLVPAYETTLGTPSKRNPLNAILPYDVGTSNPTFEPLYQMRINELQQNAIEGDTKKRAQEFMDSAPKMDSQERLNKLQEMSIKDPAVYEAIIKILQSKQKEQKKAPDISIYATQPGQESGRARYIIQQVREMPAAQRETFINQMIQQGVMTTKVQEALMKQLQPSSGNKYGESTLERIKRLLVPSVGAADISPQNSVPLTQTSSNETTTQVNNSTGATTNAVKITQQPVSSVVRKTKVKKVSSKLLAAAKKKPKKVKVRKTRRLKLRTSKKVVIKNPRLPSTGVSTRLPKIKKLKIRFPTLSGASLKP